MKKSWLIIGCLALALLAAVWWLRGQEALVPAIQLHREDVTATLTVTGEVRGDTTVSFSPPVTAKITRILVDEGDRVQKGQLLAQLENRETRAKAQQAQAQVKQARQAYANVAQGTRPEQVLYQEQRYAESTQRVEQAAAALAVAKAQAVDAGKNAQRFQQLFKQELVSTQEYEAAQLQRTVSQKTVEQRQADVVAVKRQQSQVAAQLQEARNGPTRPQLGEAREGVTVAQDNANAVLAQLNDYKMVSSISGVVLERFKDPGDLGRPGDAILKIVNPETLEVVCSVEEKDLAKVRVGDLAYVVLDALPDVGLQGKVRRVGSQVNPDNGTVEARVILLPSAWSKLKTVGFLPGMTADVNVITGHLKQALVIPAAAVKNENGRWFVYLLREKRFVKQFVQGERISIENFRVAQGLKEGDWIAALANEKLLEKRNVKPVKATEQSAAPPVSR
ncbi:efflux RND transporter periplasmic adaptor subunit [Vampirovibrio sp.]|uniref:efflux RND transporter periplasmic adaptor subunit n=1 Tax=Vampirovibrio sp. TaxID=2717857 RepID=UPI00359410CF